jgi:hypothetical protein
LTSSEHLTRLARRSIDTVQRMLDPGVMSQKIDEPIDRALREFRFAWPESPTITRFHVTIGRFLHHLCRALAVTGVVIRMDLSIQEAVGLLEAFYPGECGNGHENAVQDLMDPPPQAYAGIDHNLLALADLLKARLSEQYTTYVWARHVECLPPAVKRRMARMLLQDPHVRRCPLLRELRDFEVAPQLPDLLRSLLEAQSMARHLQNGDYGSY